MHVIHDIAALHVGDSVLGQLASSFDSDCRRSVCGAHFGDRFAVCAPTQLDAPKNSPNRCAQASSSSAACTTSRVYNVSISIGVALLDTAAGEVMHPWQRPRQPAKPRRIGAETGRGVPGQRPSLVRRFADINIVGQLRAAIDADRVARCATHRSARRSGKPQPHFELLLRMLDEDGHSVGPDRFLSAANPLPAHARSRSLGHQEGDRDCSSRTPSSSRDLDVVRH